MSCAACGAESAELVALACMCLVHPACGAAGGCARCGTAYSDVPAALETLGLPFRDTLNEFRRLPARSAVAPNGMLASWFPGDALLVQDETDGTWVFCLVEGLLQAWGIDPPACGHWVAGVDRLTGQVAYVDPALADSTVDQDAFRARFDAKLPRALAAMKWVNT